MGDWQTQVRAGSFGFVSFLKQFLFPSLPTSLGVLASLHQSFSFHFCLFSFLYFSIYCTSLFYDVAETSIQTNLPCPFWGFLHSVPVWFYCISSSVNIQRCIDSRLKRLPVAADVTAKPPLFIPEPFFVSCIPQLTSVSDMAWTRSVTSGWKWAGWLDISSEGRLSVSPTLVHKVFVHSSVVVCLPCSSQEPRHSSPVKGTNAFTSN